MADQIRMGVRRIAGAALCLIATATPSHACAANSSSSSFRQSSGAQSSTQNPDAAQEQSQGDSSSSRKSSHKTPHHTTVEETEDPQPELGKAEDLIQKRDYAGAEPLLQKVLQADPTNYVAWFDLGFAENALGKVDESIAAYRKSVEAKPNVFESNLNLGLQLAKTNQPDAETFLRSATQLKPTNHVSEGQARAWLSLGRVLEKTKPEEAIAAYAQAGALRPNDPEPHLAAGRLLESEDKFSDAETEYKRALALDPQSEALTGLANIYMRGRRFVEA